MAGPAANPPRPGVAAFHALVDEALRHAGAARETSDYALRLGVDPQQIIGYVRAELSVSAREEMMHTLSTVPWAMGRVVALVKARRDPTSLGSRLLATEGEISPADWDVPITGDRDADLVTLLNRV